MNFTREPIIETIVSPRDGFKLLVRNSKGGSGEEYYVDALEVVSFGRTFFFRSLESPKSFLLPTSDYEVLEVKETRVALKSASYEKSIKIGGGREAPPRAREPAPPQGVREETPSKEEEAPAETGTPAPAVVESRSEKRRDRRRHRRRRAEEQDWAARKGSAGGEGAPSAESSSEPREEGKEGDELKPPPVFTPLIPPPPTLISQTLSRYKGKEFMIEPVPEEKKAEESQKKEPPKENDSDSESSSLSRAQVPQEDASLTTTHFFSPPDIGGFTPFF